MVAISLVALFMSLAHADEHSVNTGASATPGSLSIRRWEITLAESAGGWSVNESSSREIRIEHRLEGPAAGSKEAPAHPDAVMVLGVTPDSSCGAAHPDAPAVEGLNTAAWRYVGSATTSDHWCLPGLDGTIDMRMEGDSNYRKDEVAFANALASNLIETRARVWVDPATPAKKQPYYPRTWLSGGRYMPGRPDDVPDGHSAWYFQYAASTGSNPAQIADRFGVGHRVRVARGLAVGLDMYGGTNTGDNARLGFEYQLRVLAGYGGFPVDWFGAAAYAGVGVSGMTVFAPAALDLPVEGVVFVGRTTVAAVLSFRGSCLVSGAGRTERGGFAPFPEWEARVGVAMGPRRERYGDYGTRTIYLSGFVERFNRDDYLGMSVGFGFSALEHR